MSELADFGTAVLLISAGFGLALLSIKLTERLPIPPPAIFLVAAAAASDIWPSLYHHTPIRTVERVAVVALIVILFNGGLDIGWRKFRESGLPIIGLGVFGTFITAGIVMLFAHYTLGFGWTLAGLTGAALSPTDPAVMFSVLGNHEIAGRSQTTLEGEAGLNDPAGITLMIGMIELATHANASAAVVAGEFAIEISVGVALGVIGGLLIAAVLTRIQLPSVALQPLLALAFAAVLYGATSRLHGSGFLAVFLAGIIVAGRTQPHLKFSIRSFSNPLASLAEIAVFVALGLTVALTSLSGRTWVEGAVLTLALAVVARPVTIMVVLAGARFTWAERAFMAWSGLKGAVPILLAAFAVLEHVNGAKRIYNVVFVVVLLSVICQGTFVGHVARRLGVSVRRSHGRRRARLSEASSVS
jgi:cell volume regulation protein A